MNVTSNVVKNLIIGEIDNFTVTTKSDYYIGITDNIEERLRAHNIDIKDKEKYKYYKANSEEDARNIEKHFLKLGMKGSDGGGKNPVYVYCYRRAFYTKP